MYGAVSSLSGVVPQLQLILDHPARPVHNALKHDGHKGRSPFAVDLAKETGDTVSFLSEEISVFLCPVLSVADDGQAELLIGSAPRQVDVGEQLHQVTAKPRVVTFVSQCGKDFY